MPVLAHWSSAERCLTLQVSGRFDAALHADFRGAWETFEPRPAHFVVDLEGALALDASALGMLLHLRQRALRTNATVALAKARPRVARALDAAHFERWFASA